jgi:hypothetical protein
MLRICTTKRFCVLPAILFCFVSAPLCAATTQEAADPIDPWGPLRLLVGSWKGSIDGMLGTGAGIREYAFILRDNFLLSKHSSVRLPQEKSPGGDQHEELGIFSFDRERKKIVYRQFVNEGFVNRYVCDVEPNRFVCVTESVENGSGMRARWTVTIASRYAFEETFELASPGKDFSHLFTNRWVRVPSLK